MADYEQQQPGRAVTNMKYVLSAYKYHQIHSILIKQVNRIGTKFGRMENDYLANKYPKIPEDRTPIPVDLVDQGSDRLRES